MSTVTVRIPYINTHQFTDARAILFQGGVLYEIPDHEQSSAHPQEGAELEPQQPLYLPKNADPKQVKEQLKYYKDIKLVVCIQTSTDTGAINLILWPRNATVPELEEKLKYGDPPVQTEWYHTRLSSPALLAKLGILSGEKRQTTTQSSSNIQTTTLNGILAEYQASQPPYKRRFTFLQSQQMRHLSTLASQLHVRKETFVQRGAIEHAINQVGCVARPSTRYRYRPDLFSNGFSVLADTDEQGNHTSKTDDALTDLFFAFNSTLTL